jgi:serine phosphatase RsbU (regulator of sigma subunit)
MLPKGNLRLDKLEITGAMRTATEVGGDYYDFLPLPDGRCCVVIGDATGHGMSAGLIVGMVKMGLTSRLQTAPNLQPMIEDLNTALKQSLTHRGVGMCLGATILDPKTLHVELCSNGMPYPYHFTNGELRPIELKAQPLGFLKRVNVPTATLQLQPGEALIWLSDGFEERMNARNEEWGAAQVAAALTEICAREESGEAIAQALLAACDRAAGGRSNDDDMTIVVMKAVANITA